MMRLIPMFLSLLSSALVADEWKVVDHETGMRALRLAHDAQLTRESGYGQGLAWGRVAFEGKYDYDAECRVVWDNENVCVETIRYQCETLSRPTPDNPEGEIYMSKLPHEALLLGKKESWLYIPERNQCLGDGLSTKRSVRKNIDIRPLSSWSTYGNSADHSMSKLLQGFLKSKPERCRFEQSGNEKIRFFSRAGTEFEVSLITGDLLRYSYHIPAENEKAPSNPPDCHDTTWEWSRDSQGLPYCKKWTKVTYRDDARRDELHRKTIDILEYDSQPPKSRQTFTLEAMKVAVGTKVMVNGPSGARQWTVGEKSAERKGVSQADLDALIRETRGKGLFSTSSRNRE